MAEGMTEIEQRAGAALLALIGLDDRHLGATAGGDGPRSLGAFAGEDPLPALFEPGEERGVAEEPVFQHLGIARTELARAQRGEDRDVGEHEARLMERADQVLALGRVDAGLAADRGIDLGEQRRRDLHEADAAAKDARREARKIAHHAAAKGDHRVAALDAKIEQLLADLGEHGKALARFAGRDHDLAEIEPAIHEARLQPREIERGNGRVAHHGAAGARHALGDARGAAVEQALADDDIVAPLGEPHSDGGLVQVGRQRSQLLSHHRTLLRPPVASGAVSPSSQRPSASTTS